MRGPSTNMADGEPDKAGTTLERRFASLTAGLLARKGEAQPAMESFDGRAPWPQPPRASESFSTNAKTRPPEEAPREASPEGEAAPQPSLAAAAPKTVHVYRHRTPDRKPASFAKAAKAAALDPACKEICGVEPASEAQAEAPQKRAAVTFRLTPHDFLRLKLAGAELSMSGQDILTEALSAYLDVRGVESFANCRCLREAADRLMRVPPATDAAKG